MRLPFVSRKHHDDLLEQERQARKSAERAAANAGHSRDQVLYETGKLATELRLFAAKAALYP